MKTMRITVDTKSEEIARRTRDVIENSIIPNMLLKNEGKPNGFVSQKKDYQYWIKKVCERHSES